MSNVYELHGGPWHGQRVELEPGRDHFHILMPLGVQDFSNPEGDLLPDPIRTREGTYSRISGMPGHLEWDGWVTHD